jgi:hypothetical protein
VGFGVRVGWCGFRGGGGVAGWGWGCKVGFGVGVGWVSVGFGGCGFRGWWWVAEVGLGGWQGWVCFTLLQTHNVEYFLGHFPIVQTNTGKTNILL